MGGVQDVKHEYIHQLGTWGHNKWFFAPNTEGSARAMKLRVVCLR